MAVEKMPKDGGKTEPIENLKNNSISQQNVDKPKKVVDKSVPKKGKKKSTGKGGARPGAGRPKGGMNAETIEKMKVKQAFEARVALHANALFNAQMSLAMGTQMILKRVKKKTNKGWRWSSYEKVTDEKEILEYLDGKFDKDENQFFVITVDKPDARAIDSMLDRLMGKAPQNLNIKDDREDPIGEILKKYGLLDDEGNSTDARETANTP